MKKLYFSIFLAAIGFSVSAQDTLKPINWITFPTATEWANTPVTKNLITIPKAAADWTFDENNFDLSTFWTTPGMVAENQVKNQTQALGGLSYINGKLGATWKAWYDAENLYVGIKYCDKNLLIADHSREVEVMYQTKYYDRYEPGYQAAKLIETKNWQYARYHSLGGQKVWIKDGIFSDASAGDGVGGFTGDDIIGQNPPIVVWNVDGTNIAWVTVKLSFADHMFYLDDISLPADGANIIPFDPTVKDTISWDVKINALDASMSADNGDQWMWNSTLNDGFEAIYYSGYLKFGDNVLTSVAKPIANPAINVFLAGDMIKMQGIQKGNLKVYSILGQLVKSANMVHELYVGDLNQGIYLIKLNDLSKSFKIVKR